MLLTAAPGDRLKLNGSGLAMQRKLSAHGTSVIAFAGTVLSSEEAHGTFTWLGEEGRDTIVRSGASGREGRLFRGMLRRA